MRLLRRQKAWDLAIVAAVIALGGAALADALRDGTTAEEGEERRAPSVPTTNGEASPPRLPGVAAPGLIAFTAPGACELRAFDLRSGRTVDIPRLATTCELWIPRVGTVVAYRVPDDLNGATMHFRVLDLKHPKANSREYRGFAPIAWRPDGSRLAWCDTSQSGFELSFGQRPRRVDYCPAAYDKGGETASVGGPGRRQISVGGRPLLKARGFVSDLAWGVDGSLALVVDGQWVDRYQGGRLVSATILPPATAEFRTILADLAPDNCAALSVDAAVVTLIDLGCFRGRAPRTFKGMYAAWSPDGHWIAVAEPDAVVFHRVVGREASVRWNVAVGQLAWVGA